MITNSATTIKSPCYDNFATVSVVAGNDALIRSRIAEIVVGTTQEFWANDRLSRVLEKYEFSALEEAGIIITAFNQKYPHGTYARNLLENPRQIPDGTIFRLSKSPSNSIAFKTKAPQTMGPEQLALAPFKYIPTAGQLIGVYTANKWNKFQLIPAADNIMSAMNSTTQYGQSAFEGMIASRTRDGRSASIFRPERNAKRFNLSLTRLGIPEIPEDQFVRAVEQVVRANSEYLPESSAAARLYIRPFVIALNGGTKVSAATEYLFVIQVFPFCSYTDPSSGGLNIVTIAGTERALPGTGNHKLSANYASTLSHSAAAHSGALEGFEGQKFDGVFYTYQVTGSDEVFVDEYSAANLFFIKTGSAGPEIYTPTLEHDRILPGITRASVLDLLRHKGHSPRELDISSAFVNEMDAAFLTGSAAGITPVASMTFSPGNTKKFISNSVSRGLVSFLQDDLARIRSGDISGYEKDPIAKWPHIIAIS